MHIIGTVNNESRKKRPRDTSIRQIRICRRILIHDYHKPTEPVRDEFRMKIIDKIGIRKMIKLNVI